MNNAGFLCDATGQPAQNNFSVRKQSFEDFGEILHKLSAEHYISMFFLLMDYHDNINFLSLTKLKQPLLKDKFRELYDNVLSEDILVELFGTMKLYKYLKYFNVCSHIYKLHEDKWNKIDKIWKILYLLCEEITDEDLNKLKHRRQGFNIDQISSAEDFFYYAIQKEIITKYNLSQLKIILSDFPVCLSLLSQYEDEPKIESYLIKTPTKLTPCGIAVIFNFEKFESMPHLQERTGSDIDVHTLKSLWETYGFKTTVLSNLSKSDTVRKFNSISLEDHSEYDVFVCCILSHGELNSVYTSDGLKIPVLELIAPITNKCKSLNSKPKLFFIQACQGTRIHPEVPNNSTNSNCNFIQSQAPDLCIINSTFPGYVSYRSQTKGSLFIQILNRVMLSFKRECSIQSVMFEVIKEMEKEEISMYGINCKQISPVIHTLKKNVVMKRMLH